MTHKEAMAALVEALAKVPPDERDQWGEYPAHNDAAYDLGIRTNGSAPGEICNVRLGMLGKSGPTIALAAEIVEALTEWRECERQMNNVSNDTNDYQNAYNALVAAWRRIDELLQRWEGAQ